MAKDKAKDKAPAADKKIGKSAADHGFKFGVADIAKALNTTPALTRGRLRRASVPKSDAGVYGWKTDKERDAIVKQLQKAPEKKGKAEPKNGGEKPAKPEKAAKSEKSSRAEATV